MTNYSMIELPAPYSDTPGEVVQHGSLASTDDVIELSLLFPGKAVIGTQPPEGVDAYWDYSATPPDWHVRPARPSPLAEWDYVARVWGAGNLTARREAQWAVILAANIEADAQNLTWSTHEFQVDTVSRERLREALLDSMLATAAGETWSIVWTLADNGTVTLSAADIAAVHRALAARTDANHQHAQSKRSLINTSTSPEDITWTSTP